jgi:hypothetical protein
MVSQEFPGKHASDSEFIEEAATQVNQLLWLNPPPMAQGLPVISDFCLQSVVTHGKNSQVEQRPTEERVDREIVQQGRFFPRSQPLPFILAETSIRLAGRMRVVPGANAIVSEQLHRPLQAKPSSASEQPEKLPSHPIVPAGENDKPRLMRRVLAAVAENQQSLFTVMPRPVGIGLGQRLHQTLAQHFDRRGCSEGHVGDHVSRSGRSSAAEATRSPANETNLRRVIRGISTEGERARIKRSLVDGLPAHLFNSGSTSTGALPGFHITILRIVLYGDIRLLPSDVVEHPLFAQRLFAVGSHLPNLGISVEAQVIGSAASTQEKRRGETATRAGGFSHRIDPAAAWIHATHELPASAYEPMGPQAQGSRRPLG